MMPDYHTDNPIKDWEQDDDLLVVRARNLAMFHAGISHDLNGHLNAMVVNLEMVKQVRTHLTLTVSVQNLQRIKNSPIPSCAPLGRS
jgi:hypothetical protein